MNFKNDPLFAALVDTHKKSLEASSAPGNLSMCQSLARQQMNLQERIMRKYPVSFFELHGSMIQSGRL